MTAGAKQHTGGGSGTGSGVSSFNSRTGTVLPQTNDYTVSQVTGAAPLASPSFTGVPLAPTATAGTNTTQIATTAFVTAAVAAGTGAVSSVFTRTGAVTAQKGDYNATQVPNVVVTVTQSATPAIDTDNGNIFSIVALAQAITSMTTNLTGTPVDGQDIRIRITDNGTARAITWGASFEATSIALPTTTVGGQRLSVQFTWNTVTSKWDCIGVA